MIPKEVTEAYETVNTAEFREERCSRSGYYLCAANSLYAISPPSVLLETFNKYEEKKLTLNRNSDSL